MGSDARAVLVYGYDLGGPDSEWKIPESVVDFIDNYHNPEDDFATNLEELILRELVRFTEDYPSEEVKQKDPKAVSEYYQRRREAELKVPIKVELYSSYDYPGYLIGTQVHRANDWLAKEIVIELDHSASNKFEALFKAWHHRIETEPKWILAPFYG
jgi:hypothetical protein